MNGVSDELERLEAKLAELQATCKECRNNGSEWCEGCLVTAKRLVLQIGINLLREPEVGKA